MKPLAPDDPRHGRYSTYTNHRCRCDACRAANTEKCRKYMHRTGRARPRAEQLAESAALPPPQHGTEYRYGNKFKCRCALCRAAATLARATRRLRNPEHQRAYDRAYKRQRRLRTFGDEDAALIRRHDALVQARAAAEGELAALVREQELDDRYRIGRRGWLISFDAADAYGRTLHETLGEQDVAA